MVILILNIEGGTFDISILSINTQFYLLMILVIEKKILINYYYIILKKRLTNNKKLILKDAKILKEFLKEDYKIKKKNCLNLNIPNIYSR